MSYGVTANMLGFDPGATGSNPVGTANAIRAMPLSTLKGLDMSPPPGRVDY